MHPPLCLVTGVLRSGSTWSFNVCRGIAQYSARVAHLPTGSEYLTPDQLDQWFKQTGGKTPGPTVLKAHGAGPLAIHALRTALAKAVVTHRDPRDCVASLLRFRDGETFDAALQGVERNFRDLDAYVDLPAVLLVRYDDMMADAKHEIRRIAAHLGVILPEPVVAKVEAFAGIDSARRVGESLRFRPESQVRRSGSHLVDPATSLHDRHIIDGRSGRFRSELSPEQVALLNERFAPWLARYGYPVNGNRTART